METTKHKSQRVTHFTSWNHILLSSYSFISRPHSYSLMTSGFSSVKIANTFALK